MARDYNDYEDLLKNFDSYSNPPRNAQGNMQRNPQQNTQNNQNRNYSSNAGQQSRNTAQRSEFHRDEIRPTPIRSDTNSNNVYFDRNSEPPTPKRQQNPNSPFYRDPNKDLPTPKSSSNGNPAFKAAKGMLPKSKADAYLDELDRAERNKQGRFERDNKSSYKGEVYFSNPPKEIEEVAQQQRGNKSASPYGKYARSAHGDRVMTSAPPVVGNQKRILNKKKEDKQRRSMGAYTVKERLKHLMIYLLIVGISSFVICFYGIRCINDVLAIDKRNLDCEVTISAGATDAEVISILKENDLIKNKLFCEMFVKFVKGEGKYVSGSYSLNSDWGIEKMLSTMQEGNSYTETITLTFPEGWTIDQIAEKLEANKVCTASSFIKTMQSVDFSQEYKFLVGQDNKELRFRTLEGYIYPDTYEFYIGENASSVVRRFLDNFESKWTSEYQSRAEELDMTVDEIVTLASIIQAEAANTKQMKNISSVFHNRLDKPGTFPRLESDTTEKYLRETIKVTLTSSTADTQKYIAYRDLYDTYDNDCQGLPVGAICNPGSAAISAALNPSDTDYNYFRHDAKGNVYYASTLSEHNQNGYKAAAIDD